MQLNRACISYSHSATSITAIRIQLQSEDSTLGDR